MIFKIEEHKEIFPQYNMYTTNIIENFKKLFIWIALSKYFHKNVKSM